jgi:RHH-type proline utilization regulon transcriptional repressor/proline dehydrogenase/delta 1-pyrroline-5-carboxylate dehydrogenase
MTPAIERARILTLAADLYERDRAPLMAALVREAGKTLEAAQSEIREAVDFLRYYANEARRLFSEPIVLRGPTGEENTLTLRARGPFACISPWNFPLAIFTGQVAAALAAGNWSSPSPQSGRSRRFGGQAVAGSASAGVHLVTGGGNWEKRDQDLRMQAWPSQARTSGVGHQKALDRRNACSLHCRDRRHQCHDRRQRFPSKSCATRCAQPSTARASAVQRRAFCSFRTMRRRASKPC